MEITIVEPSLHEIVEKAINLSKEGYSLKSVLLLGWSYELQMTKDTEELTKEPAATDRMAKARAARGTNGSKE